MSRVLLDTSAVSAIMARRRETLERLRQRRPGDFLIASPVAAEIRFGLELLRAGSRRRRNLEREYRRLREAVGWEDWNEEAAEEFGRQKAGLASRGRLVEDMDIAIGAIAVVAGAAVATYNARHFSRLRGLCVEDWGATP